MLDYEKVCINAIQVVGKYLASDLVAADIHEELQEAQRTVSDAWDEVESRKARRICRTAWHACLAAKLGDRRLARIHVWDFWNFMHN